MKHLPYSVIETAVNSLQFSITTRARIDASRGHVVCCPPNVTKPQGMAASLALSLHGLNNDVIDDAIVTAVVTADFVREHHRPPLIGFDGFEYTAQQYTVALQNLLSALPGFSDGKE